MLTIITPCSRPHLLEKLKNSINFEKIDKWFIVYDTSKNRQYEKQFNDKKIFELFADGSEVNSKFGNHQRNVAIKLVKDGYIYFLDDDNLMHPDFFNYDFKRTNDTSSLIFTFDILLAGRLVKGSNPKVNSIDTANFLVHKDIVKDTCWISDRYNADGYFIEQLVKNNDNKYTYVDKTLGYRNKLGNG